jgi:hypothetical protein
VDGAYVIVIDDLTLSADVNVPAGVGLIVTGGKTLTVNPGKVLDLTGGGLVLANTATLTVNGVVNAKGSASAASFGIVLMPGTNATINGSGTIHLKTRGTLLNIRAGQKLTLDGTITLDGLKVGGTDSDTMNNVGHVVFVSGELDMKGGTITGNYNTTTAYDGGGVEVNGEDGGVATFTMSGSAEVSDNKTARGGGGVNVVHGGTFIMEGNAKVSGNTADAGEGGGGVRVNQGGYGPTTFTMKGSAEISGNSATSGNGGGVWVHGGTFTLEGGTINGSSGGNPNTVPSGSGASLYVESGTGAAKWGSSGTFTGGDGGTTADGDIISGGAGSTNDTLTAVP